MLLDNVWFSLVNFAVGFLLAAVVGILLGLALGTIGTFRTPIGSIVWIAYSTPRVAVAPLIVMWLGFGAESKVAVIFLMAIFPIIINVWVGAGSVDQTLLRAGRVFGASSMDLYRKVTLPYILPYTLTGLRLGIARGLIGVVIAEFIGSAAGVGWHDPGALVRVRPGGRDGPDPHPDARREPRDDRPRHGPTTPRAVVSGGGRLSRLAPLTGGGYSARVQIVDRSGQSASNRVLRGCNDRWRPATAGSWKR
ncbi:MAG: ABC transporter permease subunit [Chloroflexota bacterium]